MNFSMFLFIAITTLCCYLLTDNLFISATWIGLSMAGFKLKEQIAQVQKQHSKTLDQMALPIAQNRRSISPERQKRVVKLLHMQQAKNDVQNIIKYRLYICRKAMGNRELKKHLV